MARFAVGCLPYPSSLVSPQHKHIRVQVPHELEHKNSSGSIFIIFVLAILLVLPALAENSISASAAKNHIGENATVCGQVVSTHFADTSRGKPTFLNLDEPYPNQIFTIVIWGNDRPKFDNPESKYKWKAVCVSGTIESYRSIPQIVAREPGQITTKER